MLIMNEIATKLDSKIEFTSVPEKGSHFWFNLKLDTQISEQINLPVIHINLINKETDDNNSSENTIEFKSNHNIDEKLSKFLDYKNNYEEDIVQRTNTNTEMESFLTNDAKDTEITIFVNLIINYT